MLDARSLAMTACWQNPVYRERRRISRTRALERIRAGEGFIYVAEVVGGSLIKIGFSLKPKARVATLARKCRLLATVAASLTQEKALHQTLKGLGRGGEYYPRSILSHPAIPAELRATA